MKTWSRSRLKKAEAEKAREADERQARLDAEQKERERQEAADAKKAAAAAAEAQRQKEKEKAADVEKEVKKPAPAPKKAVDVKAVKAALDKQDEWAAVDDSAEIKDFESDDASLEGKFPDQVYDAFNVLSDFARKLRLERAFHRPEFLFVGPRGSGKTRVIEALMGMQLMREPTKRPIEYMLVNKPENKEPIITILHDTVSGLDQTEVEATAIPEELSKRNVETTVPLIVRYEYQSVLNTSFIDTPGISRPGEAVHEQNQQIIIDQAEDDKRQLVFVFPAQLNWEHAQVILDLADEIDPKWYRSMFVFTKFHYVLKSLDSKNALNEYLSARPPAKVDTFFVSSPSQQALDAAGKQSATSFQIEMSKAATRDNSDIDDRLKGSSKLLADHVGIAALRLYIVTTTYKKYADAVPQMQKQLRLNAKMIESDLDEITRQLGTLNNNTLRATASSWSSQYLQLMTTALGSSGGIPNAVGETLADEERWFEPWVDAQTSKPIFDGSADLHSKLEHASAKLYGANQLTRLMREFKTVSQSLDVGKLSTHDVATARGMNGAHLFTKLDTANTQSLLWVASDIAGRMLRVKMGSLIEQFFQRVSHVMRNMSSTVEGSLEAQQDSNKLQPTGFERSASMRTLQPASRSGGGLDLNLTEFRKFWWFVRELWERYVDEQSAICKSKCSDQIACTKLLTWDASKAMPSTKLKGTEGYLEVVTKLASDLFDQHRDRIVQNVLLKVHEMLLVNIQRDVSGVIQASVNILTDDEMTQMFSLADMKGRLQAREKKLKGSIDITAEPKLMTAVGKFRL